MLNDKQILSDIHSLPPDKQTEVLDFIEFVKTKAEAKDKPAVSPLGAMTGLVKFMSDEFDAPLEDFADYME